MEEGELYMATQVLSYMFQTCLLIELGLSEDKIVAVFERNQVFLFTTGYIDHARYWT